MRALRHYDTKPRSCSGGLERDQLSASCAAPGRRVTRRRVVRGDGVSFYRDDGRRSIIAPIGVSGAWALGDARSLDRGRAPHRLTTSLGWQRRCRQASVISETFEMAEAVVFDAKSRVGFVNGHMWGPRRPIARGFFLVGQVALSPIVLNRRGPSSRRI